MEGVTVSAAANRRSVEAMPTASEASDVALQVPQTLIERLRLLRETVAAEANAILAASKTLSTEAVTAAELTAACTGSIVVTGVGKAGLVGQKLVATLASTGSPAHFLHPSEAVHGDLGRVQKNDLVWAISNSGKSEEVVRIAPHLRQHSSGLIAITANMDNPLAESADCVVAIGSHAEACPNGLAPTSSTAVMMAVGDSIAMLASRIRQFTPADFARFHPGGSLGRKLSSVDQLMRSTESCRIAPSTISIRQAMVTASRTGRRSGAVMLVNERGQLQGIFTDSDLARLLESRNESALDQPMSQHMTANPITVQSGSLLQDAKNIMAARRISELPVVGQNQNPIGMLDITDLISLGEVPEEAMTIPMR